MNVGTAGTITPQKSRKGDLIVVENQFNKQNPFSNNIED